MTLWSWRVLYYYLKFDRCKWFMANYGVRKWFWAELLYKAIKIWYSRLSRSLLIVILNFWTLRIHAYLIMMISTQENGWDPSKAVRREVEGNLDHDSPPSSPALLWVISITITSIIFSIYVTISIDMKSIVNHYYL